MSESGPWKVVVARQPEKVLRKLPKDLLKRIDLAISSLSQNPRPPGNKKLSGYENLYRVRVGDWRISYAIEEDKLIVLILEISPRGEAHRNL